MRLKKILQSYENKFDKCIENIEKNSKKDLLKREKKIEVLKKKLKKLENFIKDKAKYLTNEPIKIPIDKSDISLLYSPQKGFFISKGKHKNFTLKQCLGFFKSDNLYIKSTQKLLRKADKVLEKILFELKESFSKK